MVKGITLPKFNDTTPNEDAFFISEKCIAISDGAGGCGLFSADWSHYLIDQLPKETPISTFEELDLWVGNIWESFYNECESQAQKGDGLLLSKFYKEGSCATLVSGWINDKKECIWCSYGDSVIFHYNYATGILEHSFTSLPDFSKPPMLISSKDSLDASGFHHGKFILGANSVIIAASDALSHYILMMYELANKQHYKEELKIERNLKSSNTNLLYAAESINIDFKKDVIDVLYNIADNKIEFNAKMKELNKLGVLDIDDYTLIILK